MALPTGRRSARRRGPIAHSTLGGAWRARPPKRRYAGQGRISSRHPMAPTTENTSRTLTNAEALTSVGLHVTLGLTWRGLGIGDRGWQQCLRWVAGRSTLSHTWRRRRHSLRLFCLRQTSHMARVISHSSHTPDPTRNAPPSRPHRTFQFHRNPLSRG